MSPVSTPANRHERPKAGYLRILPVRLGECGRVFACIAICLPDRNGSAVFVRCAYVALIRTSCLPHRRRCIVLYVIDAARSGLITSAEFTRHMAMLPPFRLYEETGCIRVHEKHSISRWGEPQTGVSAGNRVSVGSGRKLRRIRDWLDVVCGAGTSWTFSVAERERNWIIRVKRQLSLNPPCTLPDRN